MAKNKKLLVVGDRVLVLPEQGEERTNVGLFLPKTAIDGQAIQGGRIVACGPGIPMGDPGEHEDEPWKQSGRSPKYLSRCKRAKATTRSSSAEPRSRSPREAALPRRAASSDRLRSSASRKKRPPSPASGRRCNDSCHREHRAHRAAPPQPTPPSL